MARIYYKEERIQDKTIETEIINIDNFLKIINTTAKPSYRINKIFSFNKYFKHYVICNDGISYSDSKKGKFYLPKSIIFYDTSDFTFPSEFYFVALIGNKLELMKANGGNNIKWHEMTERYHSVDDEKTIKKIENSIIEILNEIKNYRKPEKQKKEKIKGIKLNEKAMEDFLEKLNVERCFASKIVEMAYSPTDYFDKNENLLKKYQIYDASKNMYLLYLVGLLEEKNILRTVDWKAGFDDIILNLKQITDIPVNTIDVKKYRRKTAGEILSIISEQIEKETDKTLFCIDTDSDSCSFGIIEKTLFEDLVRIGSNVKIKIFANFAAALSPTQMNNSTQAE